MADRWLVATSAPYDLSVTGSWSASRGGGSGASVPTSSDTAYIYDGDGDIAGGVSLAAGVVKIGGAFRGNIGGAGTALLFSTAAADVTVESVAPGRTYNIGPAAATTMSVAFKVDTAGNGVVNIVAGASGVITTLRLGASGVVNVDGSCAVTNIVSAGITVRSAPCSTAYTTATFAGGSLHTLERNAATLTIGPGVSVGTTNSVAITTTVTAWGTLIHNSSGTITNGTWFPGSELRPVATAFTVTDRTLYEGSSVPGFHKLISFTNAPTTVGRVGG